MSCYYHEERESVAVCSGCGKSLCAECANLVTPIMCRSCISECESNAKKEMFKSILIGVVVSVVFCVITKELSGIYFFCVPFGWAALNKITPNVFLFLPLVGWFIYFFIKFIISFLIGWIGFAIQMYRWIKTINIAKQALR